MDTLPATLNAAQKISLISSALPAPVPTITMIIPGIGISNATGVLAANRAAHLNATGALRRE